MSLTRKVGYKDLDLATHAGAAELEKRVNDTAKSLCERLDKLNPMTTSQGPSCIKEAASAALVQAHAAIAAADARASTAAVGKPK